jgi:hypothetical protein
VPLLDKYNKIYDKNILGVVYLFVILLLYYFVMGLIKIIHIRISHFKQCKQYRYKQSLNEPKFEVAFLIVGYGHSGSRSIYLSVDEFSSVISVDVVC